MKSLWSNSVQHAGLVLAAALWITVSACSGIPESHYYSLTIADTSEASATAAEFQAVLGVERLDPGLMYFDDRIVYRADGNEVRYWNYHKWIAPPHILMTEAVRSHLKAASLFRDVVNYPGEIAADWKISGRILTFEEHNTPQGREAVVALEVRLVEPVSRKMVWTKTYRRVKPATGKGAPAIVRTFDAAVQEILAQLTADIKSVMQGIK